MVMNDLNSVCSRSCSRWDAEWTVQQRVAALSFQCEITISQTERLSCTRGPVVVTVVMQPSLLMLIAESRAVSATLELQFYLAEQ